MASDLAFNTTMDFAYGVPKEVAPGVVRIVANNPSPFTFKGTNTYVVGTATLAVIDPGPEDPAHRDAILAAIAGRPVSHIVVTHTHRDHVDGLPGLVAQLGAPTCGFGRTAAAPGALKLSPSGSEFVDQSFAPDQRLVHGDAVTGPDWRLEALHTPGHAPDHLCFALAGTGILFSGDHVMGWNTSVVAPPEGRMSDYLGSLDLLARRTDDSVYFPGHGGRIHNPQRLVKAFIIHRTMREQAIRDAIRSGSRTIPDIVAIVYRGLDARLVKAAALSVEAHVEHMIEKQTVSCDGSLRADHALSVV